MFVGLGGVIFYAAPALPSDANSLSQARPSDELSGNPEVHITYYDVSGKNADEIRSSINHSPHRPPASEGRQMDALTTTNYEWSWWDNGNGRCDPSRAQATLKAEVILPRLIGPVSRELSQQWNRYMANLRLHEAGHVEIAKTRFADVLAAVQSPDCAGINNAIKRIIGEVQQAGAEYDRQTKHGITQGAVFP